MVREVVTIGVGQGGLQVGNSIWEQYMAEHKVDHTGKWKNQNKKDQSFATFFEEIESSQRFVPRYLGVDLESSVIDDVKNGPLGGAYNKNYFVNGTEDAANIFARGYYTVGKEIMDTINSRLRHLVESCDALQGFSINHSVGGGTGSGLGGLILERLSADYNKVCKIGFEVYPSPNISTCIVEPYNTMFASHLLCDYINVSVVMDNEALYGICQQSLGMKTPSYVNLNRIISKVASCTTSSLRFAGEQNVDMTEFEVNLVPFPRLHFMTSSLSPIVSKTAKQTSLLNTLNVTKECFTPNNFLVKYPHFNPEDDKYMAINLNYRGKVSPKEANESINWIKDKQKIHLVDFVPTGFKLGLSNEPLATTKNDDMAHNNLSCAMLGNNVAIRSVFERCLKKTKIMYSQRAYVHWYVGEGLEEGEFDEAKEDLEYLIRDYEDACMPDGASDGESEDDDY